MSTGIDACIHTICNTRNKRYLGGIAFTLVELLLVLAVIVILAGMLMPLLGLAQRQGRIANTRATLMKVDQAVRLFRTDMRIYPWQGDLGTPPAAPAQWGNNLAWRLAWDPPAPAAATPADPDRETYLRRFHQDVSAIQRRFRFVDGCNVPPSGDGSEGTHAFRLETQTATSRTNLLVAAGSRQEALATVKAYARRWLPGTPVNGNDCTGDAQALTRMAEELTILAYTAGQLPTEAPQGIDPALPADKARYPMEDERYPSLTISSTSTIPYRYFPYNKAGLYGDDSRGPVLTTAAAKAAGWRTDYLAEGLRRADTDAAGAVLDAWGRPLVYVSTVRPGVRGYMHGLTVSIFAGAREERYGMGPQGREPTAVLASDLRTAAAPAYALEFELWSAGPDGAFAARRDDPANRDNLAVLPYLKGLQ